MDTLMLVLACLGNWLLFSFPLFQGCLEMKEQANTIEILIEENAEYKKISPWYWLLPFRKLSLEKKRALTIMRNASLNQQQMKQMLLFFDRATAWLFVSLAGLLSGIAATNTLLEKLFPHEPIWVLCIVIMIIIGISTFNVFYRLSKKREQRLITKIFMGK